MITAKDFWNNACRTDELKSPADIMIEFTKMHVEMAKKEYHKVLIKQGVVTDAGIGYFDNAYSLENIK